MPNTDPDSSTPVIPAALEAPRRRNLLSVVWLIPLVAALLGGWLVWKHYSETGPLITLTFRTAEGLEAGKTKVKHKDVIVGLVESIDLTPDRSQVLVHTRMDKAMAKDLREGCRFWVERPRIRGTSVEGLGTLLSGAYIAMDMGKASGTRLTRFTGLEKPPVIASDTPGRNFMLRAEELGSVSVGTPVYYRRVEVGQVTQFEMQPDGESIQVGIFVNSPYDRYVNSASRFWEVSGFDVEMDAGGIRLDTQSLDSFLSGGIAFQTRGGAGAAEAVTQGAEFRLYRQKELALSFDEQETATFALRFDQSLRGLSPGATVDLLGMTIGKVSEIYPMFDETRKVVYMVALVDLYISELAKVRTAFPNARKGGQEGLESLVQGGLRAQLRSGNLITGQLYVSFDFFRNAPPARVDWQSKPPRLPTTPGTLAGLEDAAAEIIRKLGKFPLDSLGEDLRGTLATLKDTLLATQAVAKRLDQEVAPEAKAALTDFRATLLQLDRTLGAAEQTLSPNAGLQRQMSDTLREVSRASAAVRTLSETLELRPESVLRGKPDEETP